MGELALVLSFDSDDVGFARGFEVGWVYGLLLSGPYKSSHMVHATNAEMVIRIAELLGYTYCAVDVGDTFLAVTLQRAA